MDNSRARREADDDFLLVLGCGNVKSILGGTNSCVFSSSVVFIMICGNEAVPSKHGDEETAACPACSFSHRDFLGPTNLSWGCGFSGETTCLSSKRSADDGRGTIRSGESDFSR